MSSKNAIHKKMHNVLMRNTWDNNNNNQAKSPEHTVQFGKDRKKALALLKTVRPIREILKNHKNGKISNNERNKQLENRVELNKQKRIHWLTKKEKKQAERNRQWKRNAPEGLNELLKNIGSSMGGKRKTRRRKHKRNKKTKRRRKKGGHHELTILGAAVGLKLYNSLTKKKRRKRGKRKTKRK
tara:strand:+ start:293 stop:844 length:552 start_codon:yes stop_codon:yes gene_type:complete